jgi:hypothetical protein
MRLIRGNRAVASTLIYLLHAFVGRAQSMRWKINHQGHLDPRFTDLAAALALIVLIVAAWMFFRSDTVRPSNTALIVPSQSVRW